MCFLSLCPAYRKGNGNRRKNPVINMNPRSCGNGGFFLPKTLKIAQNYSVNMSLLIVFFIYGVSNKPGELEELVGGNRIFFQE